MRGHQCWHPHRQRGDKPRVQAMYRERDRSHILVRDPALLNACFPLWGTKSLLWRQQMKWMAAGLEFPALFGSGQAATRPAIVLEPSSFSSHLLLPLLLRLSPHELQRLCEMTDIQEDLSLRFKFQNLISDLLLHLAFCARKKPWYWLLGLTVNSLTICSSTLPKPPH